MSTQSFKEQYTGISWFQGDTLQSAIGQSFTEFTPLQMAEYCAAIANGGTRHSASILKEVRSYDYSKTLFQRETEVLSKLDIDPEIFGYIQYGMYGVLYDAASTLKEHWLDSSIVAAAKTGTAQRGEGLVNNAMFILYAPYGDNPEIANDIEGQVRANADKLYATRRPGGKAAAAPAEGEPAAPATAKEPVVKAPARSSESELDIMVEE